VHETKFKHYKLKLNYSKIMTRIIRILFQLCLLLVWNIWEFNMVEPCGWIMGFLGGPFRGYWW